MAKESSKNRNKMRKELIGKYANKRQKLKDKMNDESLDPKERAKAMFQLSQLPRNSSKVRYRNRCAISGRPHAYYRQFGVCRVMLRTLAATGRLPGVKKSSW